MALIQFCLLYYYKNNRYLLPFVLYALFIYFVYGAGTVPQVDGYILTSVFLFIFSIWTGYTFIDLEEITLQKLTVLHYMGQVKKYYSLKIVTAWLVCLIIVFINLFVPIIGQAIGQGVFDLRILAAAFLAQNSIILLGIVTAIFFSTKIIKDKSIALIGIFIIIIISLSFQGIYDKIPDAISWVLFIFPPISVSLNMIREFNLINFIVPYIYFTVTYICWLKIIDKKLFK